METKIVCKHEFTVHPKGYTPSPGSGTWCIIRYRENSSGKVFSAKGSDLPNQPDMDVELIGTWEEDRKYGPTFQVLAHTIILPTSQSGVVAYLRSLKVGIGQAKAKSQGGEWSSVILVLSDKHEMMLRRNIIYTAVTRAKKDMTVITEVVERDHYSYSPLRHAIHNNLKDHRYTLLADRINVAMQNKQ